MLKNNETSVARATWYCNDLGHWTHWTAISGKQGTVRLKLDDTRWRTGGDVKGKLANGVGSQYSHTTSERGVSTITNADAHTSAASSRLNWRPRRLKWTPFRRKTKSGFCACAITFKLHSTYSLASDAYCCHYYCCCYYWQKCRAADRVFHNNCLLTGDSIVWARWRRVVCYEDTNCYRYSKLAGTYRTTRHHHHSVAPFTWTW